MVKLPNLIILSFFLGLLLVDSLQCSNATKKKLQQSVAKGESFFRVECSSCHYNTTVGYLNAPSLSLLSEYDSLTLALKLQKIEKDSIHRDRFESYTAKEREVLLAFIEYNSRPHY